MHVELLSTDMTKAQDFYSQIFDWTFRDIPRAGNPYTMIDVGEGTGGNFVESPLAGSNPFWLAYVAVQDMTQTLEAVLANGGTIVRDQAQEPAWAHSRSSKTRWAPPSAFGKPRKLKPDCSLAASVRRNRLLDHEVSLEYRCTAPPRPRRCWARYGRRPGSGPAARSAW